MMFNIIFYICVVTVFARVEKTESTTPCPRVATETACKIGGAECVNHDDCCSGSCRGIFSPRCEPNYYTCRSVCNSCRILQKMNLQICRYACQEYGVSYFPVPCYILSNSRQLFQRK